MREMKDSGIAWVGEIPKGWAVNRAKYCFINTKEIAGCRADDYERLALTMNGVVKRSKDDSNGLQPEKFETYQILRPDELVFKLIDLQNVSTSRVGLSPFLGLVSPAYIILKSNKKKILPSFAEKYFLVLWKNQIFNALGDAGVRSNLNSKDLLELSIPVPSLEEQQKIAEFLDGECEKIDGLTRDIQAEIETLEQYKRSVITEAVTHGLYKSAPMKDSILSWAKSIPEHWRVMPNKYLMTKIKEICPVYKGEDILSLTMNGVIVRDLDAGGKMPSSFDGYQYIKSGNLLMCLFDIDVTPRCIGIIKQDGITSPAYSQFKMKGVASARYYYYYYLMLDYTKELLPLAKNLRHSLTEEQLGSIKQLVPPLSEQEAIAEYLDKKCAEIDRTIADKKAQIETLDGYKKSLIYEYVTGKKEVL